MLPCCNTNVTVRRNGQGLMGLRSALFHAGVRTLMVTLWPVHDLASAIFMEEFCRRLFIEREPVDVALAAAKTYLRTLTVGTLRDTTDWLSDEIINVLSVERDRSPQEDRAAFDHLIKYIKELQQSKDAVQPFAHSKFWAAFVCYGDLLPFDF